MPSIPESTRVFPFVDTSVSDNGFLEQCTMTLPGVVRGVADLRQQVVNSRQVAVHGHRHSQGGQTLLHGATAVDLDRLQSIRIDEVTDASGQVSATATVQAGATWDALHQALNAYGQVTRQQHWAPLTHQSSPYFSVGGSLAVNCHGRDPMQGPVATSVLSLRWMDANGTVSDPMAATDPIVRAMLGGYGCGGAIFEATLKLKPEQVLRMVNSSMSIDKFCGWLLGRFAGRVTDLHHFHAWLRCAEDDSLFSEAVLVEGIDLDRDRFPHQFKDALDQESLVTDDMFSVIYRGYRTQANRGEQWARLIDAIQTLDSTPKRQLNAMRAPVRFMQAVPFGQGGAMLDVDLMQEYFLPPQRVDEFLKAARNHLLIAQRVGTLQVLTCTVRAVQEDSVSLLSYAPDGPRISVVINFSAPPKLARDFANPANPLTAVLRALIDSALAVGGSYYLCYGRFASLEQFNTAYDSHGQAKKLRDMRRKMDPQHRFSNHFLRTYISLP